jgi:hypothetical protein
VSVAVRLLGLVTCVLALGGCERAQTAASAAKKSDGKPWESSVAGFAAPGFQAGDAARWEAQLRERAQAQNEYLR